MLSAQSILRTQNMSLISILNFLGMSRHQLENWPHFQNGNFSFQMFRVSLHFAWQGGLVFSLCLFSWFFNCREELFRTLHIFSKDIPGIPKAHYHHLAGETKGLTRSSKMNETKNLTSLVFAPQQTIGPSSRG